MEKCKLYHYQNENVFRDVTSIEEQKELISSFLKESLKAKNLVLFIGSGCSVPTIPLMGCTMSQMLNNPDNEDILKMVKQYIGSNEIGNFSDIEGLLNWLQSGIHFEHDKSKKKVLELIFEKIKNELIKTIPKVKDSIYKKSLSIDNYNAFYQMIFNYRNILNSKLSIFTTNYDLFNEFALESNNVSYTTGFKSSVNHEFDINQFKYRLVDDTERYKDRWQPVKMEANLYKLHGSINWTQNEEGKLNLTTDDNENVIIYPTYLKNQETNQSPYAELFREFSTCLQKPNTTLIIIGYGFPDEHINNIISQNLKNEDFNLLVFGDITEGKVQSFYEKHIQHKNLHIIGGVIDSIEKDNGSGEKIKSEVKGHYFNVIVEQYLLRDFSEKGDEESE